MTTTQALAKLYKNITGATKAKSSMTKIINDMAKELPKMKAIKTEGFTLQISAGELYEFIGSGGIAFITIELMGSKGCALVQSADLQDGNYTFIMIAHMATGITSVYARANSANSNPVINLD